MKAGRELDFNHIKMVKAERNVKILLFIAASTTIIFITLITLFIFYEKLAAPTISPTPPLLNISNIRLSSLNSTFIIFSYLLAYASIRLSFLVIN